MIWKRCIPLYCVVLLSAFALAPLARSAHVADDPAPVVATADDGAADVLGLTDADRDLLRAAQQGSDPALGEMRAGSWGLVAVVLIIILIIVAAD